jgi:DnaK suppressor protein
MEAVKMVIPKLEETREYLEGERIRLNQELKVAEERRNTIEHYQPPREKTEAATQILERNQQYALTDGLAGQLAEIERAISKLDNGTYGLCDSCGKPIPPARLGIMPQATLCVSCKTVQGKTVR